MKLFLCFAAIAVFPVAAEECSADLLHETTISTSTTKASTTSGKVTTELSTATERTSESTLTTGPHTGGSTPTTTMPAPPENTYMVSNTYGNLTCIVMRGDIAFSNIMYNQTDGKETTAETIPIPRMNKTTGNVKAFGDCDVDNGAAQRLIIAFNDNWALNLTFRRGSDQLTSLLDMSQGYYNLRDIQFVYCLTPDFFPNVSSPNVSQTAQLDDIDTDFLRGKVDGGSYKCDSKITQTLDNGVQMELTNFQYKAFNRDDDLTFSGEVSECLADKGSSKVIPIAVGAVLGGLIVVMLIVYLIGHRHRRQLQGYNAL